MTDYIMQLPPWFMGVLVFSFICIMISFWAIWHAYWREFATPQERLMWLGAIIFIPFAGVFAYLIWGMNRGRKYLS